MRKITKVGLIVAGTFTGLVLLGHAVGGASTPAPAPAPVPAAAPAPAPAPAPPFVGPVGPVAPAPAPAVPAPAPAPAAPAPVVVAPAPAPVVETGPTSWTMPNLVGENLQDAQNAIQSLTDYRIFVTHSHDASGAHRLQVVDSNWQVCSQNVKPGKTITTGTAIDFGAVKLGESC